jgi:hypothetical protein
MHSIQRTGIAMLLMLMMSLAFSAQDSSILLEKAIYAEDTLGNLSDAIKIYQQVINTADKSRTTGARALYRLGMCYRKSSREAEALATFSALARLYPEQKDLITKSQMLNLKSAPWIDGEIMRYTQRLGGNPGFAGYLTNSMEFSREGGRSVWKQRCFFGYTRNPIYYLVITMDAETMIPITDRTLSNQTDLETRYARDKIEVVDLKDSAQPPKQIPSTGVVYAGWQVTSLLRRLPLREGFQSRIPMFGASSGSIANFKVGVVVRETITVPAGSFDCYKVVVTTEDNSPTEQLHWISADSHAYLVKSFGNGLNTFELKSIEITGKNQPINIEDRELGISLSATPQWYPSRISQANYLMLLAPELNSELKVTVSQLNPEQASIPLTIIAMASNMLNSKRSASTAMDQSYQVRPQTRESAAIAGLTGERYIADTRDNETGEPIVEYAYHLSSQTKNYILAFQTVKDNFDKMKPAFESMASSLKVQ